MFFTFKNVLNVKKIKYFLKILVKKPQRNLKLQGEGGNPRMKIQSVTIYQNLQPKLFS